MYRKSYFEIKNSRLSPTKEVIYMNADNKNTKKEQQRSLNKSLNIKSVKHSNRNGLPKTEKKDKN